MVNVIDIDEAPQFASDDTYVTYMPDSRTDVTTILATDEDGQDIVYSLTGIVDDGLFTIDSVTGKIDFNSIPDFENPSDVGTDNIFNLTVTATANGLANTKDVEIHLTDYDAPILHVSNDMTTSGSEFLVNSYTANSQTLSAVTTLSDGSFVVIWQSYEQDGSNYDIFGQKYSSDGIIIGAEFSINTYTQSYQQLPVVASLNDGGFIVVWTSLLDGRKILGQRYDDNGNVSRAEFEISAVNHNKKSKVIALEDGGYMVVWHEFGDDDGGGSSNGVFGQRYDASNAIITSRFLINTTTESNQDTASIAALEDGGFVVIWKSGADQDGDGYGIFGQRYDSSGATDAIGEFQVNSYTDGSQYNGKVTALDDGGFVVAWQSDAQDGDEYGIYAQRYDEGGIKHGDEIQINTTTTEEQSYVDITATQNGGFIVTWSSVDQDGDGYGVYAQRFKYSDNYDYNFGIAQDLDIIAYIQPDQASATLTSVTISDLTDGTVFSAGTDNGNNSWTFTEAQLDGLQITLGNAELYQVDLQLDAIFSNGNSGTANIQLEIGNIFLGDAEINSFVIGNLSSTAPYYYGNGAEDSVNFFLNSIDSFDIAVVDNLLELTETSSGNQLYLNSIEKIVNLSGGITTVLVEDLFDLGHIDSGVADLAEYETWLATEYNYN